MAVHSSSSHRLPSLPLERTLPHLGSPCQSPLGQTPNRQVSHDRRPFDGPAGGGDEAEQNHFDLAQNAIGYLEMMPQRSSPASR